LGEGDFFPKSTSAAIRLAQLSNNAADDNTVLRMSAYATPGPRFRKINLANANFLTGGNRGNGDLRNPSVISVSSCEIRDARRKIFLFSGRFCDLIDRNV